jgi:hypothetical protein
MSMLAPVLESFFTDRLNRQLHASAHTVRAYRDTFRLLLGYAHQRTGKQPSQLDLADLDAALITGFLDHLEHERHNTTRTRNARLAAIRSMFRYASYREPAHAALIQSVLAIPDKRTHHPIVSFLSPAEIDALVAAPRRSPSSVTSPTATSSCRPSPGTFRSRERGNPLLDRDRGPPRRAALLKDARQPPPIVLINTPSAPSMAIDNAVNNACLAVSARSTPSLPNSSVEPTTSATSTVNVRPRVTAGRYGDNRDRRYPVSRSEPLRRRPSCRSN